MSAAFQRAKSSESATAAKIRPRITPEDFSAAVLARIGESKDQNQSDLEEHMRGLLAEMLEDMLSVGQACEVLGMPRGTLYSWRHRHHYGIRIGQHVYFSQDEVLEIAGRTYQATTRNLIAKKKDAGNGKSLLEKKIEVQAWFRLEVLQECLRQSRRQGLSLEDYLQLLIYWQADDKWRQGLSPPLNFDREEG